MAATPLAIAQMCSGGAAIGSGIIDYWNTHDCPLAYQQVLNNDHGTLAYTEPQLVVVQGLVENLFDSYQAGYTFTDNVTNPRYNIFQNNIIALCTDRTLPGICEPALNTYCANKTRSLTTGSAILTSLCGCYVPPDPTYLQYTLGTLPCLAGAPGCQGCSPASATCVGQPACDPLCHRATTSHKADPSTGNIIECSQNICVIDQTVITAENSLITGGITYNQVCGGCLEADGCLCIISGDNPANTISQVGLGTNYEQFCGPASVCIHQADDGTVISVAACDTIDLDDIVLPDLYHPTWVIVTVMLVILMLVIIFLIAARFS